MQKRAEVETKDMEQGEGGNTLKREKLQKGEITKRAQVNFNPKTVK